MSWPPHQTLGLGPAGCSDPMRGHRGDRMADSDTHIFHVTLREEPSVYRDIEIASGNSLTKLAEAIVRAFDFEFDHAFGFYPDTEGRAVTRGRPASELFADMDEATGTQSVRETRIADA